jgi:hypothetical protein
MSERSYGFVKAIEFTLPWETGKEKDGSLRKDGGLHYRDRGLPTKYGIFKGANPDVDVINLTLDGAIEVYKERYWDKYTALRPVSANLDSIPAALAVCVFDAGVNCGIGFGIAWLDKALGAKNPTKTVNDLRRARYDTLVRENAPQYQPSIKGWLARVNDLQKFADILEQEAQQNAVLADKIAKAKEKLGYGPSL